MWATTPDSPAGMLSILFAADALLIQARGTFPAEEELRGVAAVVLIDPADRSRSAHRRLRSLGFGYVRDFAVVTDGLQPRWLLPVDTARIAAGALAIHAPYRWGSRAKFSIARGAARVGAARWYRPRLRLAARQRPEVDSWIAEVCGGPVRLGIARGAAGARPKPSLIVVDGAGRPLAYGKLGADPYRRAALHREARALTVLAGNERTAKLAPRLLGERDFAGTYATLQEPLPGRPGGASFTSAHERFIADLTALPGRRPLNGRAFVRNLQARASGPDLALVARLMSVLGGLQVPGAMTHGDFAPWNLRVEGPFLRAFDWEWWCEDGLPSIDQAHHELQSGFLLRGWSVQRAATLLAAKSSTMALGFRRRESAALQALGLLDYAVRMDEDGYRDHGLNALYRQLIDRVAADIGELS